MLQFLINSGYEKVIIIGGSDREADYKRIIKSAGNDPALSHAEIIYKSSGERDSDSSDMISKASASLLRKLAAEGDFEEFKLYAPFSPRDAEKLFSDVRKGMGVR
jgi:hypothetical protein